MEKIKVIRGTEKSDELLATLLWVAKARSKEESRPILHCLNVATDPDNAAGSILATTDGRRLHVAKVTQKYAPGNYEIIKESPAAFIAITADEEGTYPMYQGVIPKCEPANLTAIQLYCPKKFHERGSYLFQVAVALAALKKGAFNLDYLITATSGMKGFWAYQEDALSPVRIQNDKKNWTQLAVIMPVKTF